ncbi:MAG: polysaccharide biosynthesis/export family protein [Planctomycetales bacterium]|nr:polysaccharide biosynthesis/export family protein [Planctomycetales bacterium]
MTSRRPALALAVAALAGCTANPPDVWSYRAAVEHDPSLAKFVIPAPQWWKMRRERLKASQPLLPVPGQELVIQVWGEKDFPATVQIRSDGKVDYPLVGEVVVAGRPIADVKADLERGLARYIKDPKVVVNTVRQRRILVEDIQSSDIAVVGEVRGPRIVSFFGSETVFQALSVAGGLTPDAEWDEIAVVRKRHAAPAGGGALEELERGWIILVDAEAFFRYGDWRQNIPLEAGDIIFVPRKRTLGRRIEEDFDLVMKYIGGASSAAGLVLQLDTISRISKFGRR